MPNSPTLPITPLRLALRAMHRQGGQLRYLHHLHAVLLVALGQTVGQVGQWLGCSPRSVERWVRGYRIGGCSSLQVGHGAGRRARLTGQQLLQLRCDLAQPPSAQGFCHAQWCGRLLAKHIEQRHGLRVSLRQCQRLLRAQGPD